MQEDLFNLQNKIKDNKKKNKKIAITPFSIIELNDTQEVISNFKPLIKYIDRYGWTCLMYASSLNYIAIMSMFSKQTGKKDYLNNYTALMINIIYSNGDDEMVVDILEEEIGQQDKIGNTALMYAIRYNKINIAKALYKKEKKYRNIFNEGVNEYINMYNKNLLEYL